MKTLIIALFLVTLIFADVEIDTWILPVRIHFYNDASKIVWMEYSPGAFEYRNPEYQGKEKRPIPGKSVLFLNKLGPSGKIIISDSLYMLPDSFTCLVEKEISMKDIVLIEDASSDSLMAIGIWGNRWVSASKGEILLGQKPVFTDLIVTEQDAAYNAEHVYCFDPAFTKTQIRKLYASGGRNNPVLKKAMEENRIILIEEITP